MIFIVPHTRRSPDGSETVASVFLTEADTFAEAEQRCASAFRGATVSDAVELDVETRPQIIDIDKFRTSVP